MNAVKLIRIDFDNMENREPEVIREIGIFVSDDKLTAYGKIDLYFKNQKEQKLYLGWDDQVYPRYKLERVELK